MITFSKFLWMANAAGLRLLGTHMEFPGFIGPTTAVIGRRNIKIGKRVRIWPGARLEVFDGATLKIEDDVSIGINAHISIAADLTIGNGSVFSGLNVITNITHSLRDMDVPPLKRPIDIRPVYLGNRLFVGHGAKILPGTVLGHGCVVGANAVVSGLVACDNAVIVGIPGKIIRIVAD